MPFQPELTVHLSRPASVRKYEVNTQFWSAADLRAAGALSGKFADDPVPHEPFVPVRIDRSAGEVGLMSFAAFQAERAASQ